jgi:hypothetical protein
METKTVVLLVLVGASYVLAQDSDTPEQSYPHCSSQKFSYCERTGRATAAAA